MNPTPDNPQSKQAVPAPGSMAAQVEETLRAIANVPVPEGLEKRIHAALLKAAPRHGRILAWPVTAEPAAIWGGGNWMRAAAAAAIVFAVAGGGWGVFMHVQHPVSRAIAMPAVHPAAGGGFSSAGAMRTPQTVKGPVLAQPAQPRKTGARRKAIARPMPAPKASPGARPAALATAPGATGR